jgi:phosphatidylglycerophosphate synthase
MNYNEVLYYSLLPLFIALEAVAISFTYYAVTWSRRVQSEETISRIHKSFIGIFLVEFWYWLTTPLLSFFKILKLTPNIITAISVALSLFTCYLLAIGEIGAGGWMIVLSGSLDMLDGRLARETGQSSKAGAFFDSCSDRYSDSFVFIGLGIYFLSRGSSISEGLFTITMTDYIGVIVIMTILLGAASMSYVKARGEVAGATTKRGLMQRPERIMILSVFTVLHPFFVIVLEKYGLHPDFTLLGILIIMSILINYSAIIRMTAIFNTIKKMENSE